MLNATDKQQILDHGLTLEQVETQINYFKNGFPPTRLHAPAIDGDGLMRLSEKEVEKFRSAYKQATGEKHIVKFVPASGAATRMFKSLFEFMSDYDGSEAAYEKLIANQKSGSVFEFFKRLDEFAYYQDLKKAFSAKGKSLEEAQLGREYVSILDCFLNEKGLNYGNLPKGLLKFHKYDNTNRTPVEEHMSEGCQYAKTSKGVQIHFTVSPDHMSGFQAHVEEAKVSFEKEFGVSISVTYSVQKPSTDTIAVDLANAPFRNSDGTLLFRPAGHGALLENLNEIDADIIFLKNIDNVVPDHLKDETVKYKEALGGILAQVQSQVFDYIRSIKSGADAQKQKEITQFISQQLGYQVKEGTSADQLLAILDRPIRVCGMVKSEGDPGGGPFWVAGSDGSISLQIVETAQIDLKNQSQNEIFHQATHFNPVDLACGVRNFEGKKFDLMKYRDPSTGFSTQKSKDGKDLKAQELPGLWNGSMAYWNSVFVEVPVITFNPVKTVNDLLKPEHQ